MIWIYCALVLAASIAGGYIPLVVRLTHTRMQMAISFIAGAMLGVGLLHLLPHAVFELNEAADAAEHAGIDRAAACLLAGFLLMFFIERCFHFHQHEAPDEASEAHEHRPGEHCEHMHVHDDGARSKVGRFAWIGAMIGLMLHSTIDGIVLAASVRADQHGSPSPALPGLATFLVVFLHKPFDSMTIGTLMAAGGWSRTFRQAINGIYPLAVPFGAALFLSGTGFFSELYLGSALAFAAGCFLCIATSDLLPELQFHSHDRVKLSLALLLGLALAYGVGLMEGDAHHHHHGHDVRNEE